MQAGVPPCSLHRSTQRKSEVERSGVTRKQVALAGEGVQPVGQTAGAAGGRERTAAAISRCERVSRRRCISSSFNQLLLLQRYRKGETVLRGISGVDLYLALPVPRTRGPGPNPIPNTKPIPSTQYPIPTMMYSVSRAGVRGPPVPYLF
eukprot:scaffold126188_cov57-Phaeocystis_antarctica.AAC.1